MRCGSAQGATAGPFQHLCKCLGPDNLAWMRARTVAVLLILAPTSARAGEMIIPLTGTVPAGAPDHVFVDFEVPEGIVEIEVRHDDLSEDDILDWGLYDAAGFRGWGGGNSEPAIVGIDAASRSYVPGPIDAGTWRLVIGKALIDGDDAQYDVEIVLRSTATLSPQTERTPYVEAAPLSPDARWYAGDFHVHSRESGDARPDIAEIATFARGRGLDFVELSDHNVLTQNDFLGDAQPDHPELLLIPGMEFTTYAGHANAIGATAWVDHKIGQPDVTIDGAVAAFAEQGALVSINHPVLDLGTFCIGCAWDHEIDPATIHAIEIATTGLDQAGALFDDQAIAFWDDLCDQGAHLAAIGGSDDHRAGVDLGAFASPIGDPTTMVFARELSVTAILDGVLASRTVVKLQGPDDPMVELTSDRDPAGDTVFADTPVQYTATVTGGDGLELQVVRDGLATDIVPVVGDPFTIDFELESPEKGEMRTRLELHDDAGRRVVTSHVWQRRCDDTMCSDPPDGTTGGADTSGGPDTTSSGSTSSEATTAGTTESTGAPSEGSSGGCGCATGSGRMGWAIVVLALGARRRVSARLNPGSTAG